MTNELNFPNVENTSRVFGSAAQAYGRVINDILPSLFSDHYEFEEIDDFCDASSDPESGRAHAGQVYWREILHRSHMSSIAAMVRTIRWIDVVVREHDAHNLYGWAAACRSLIESSGDIGHSLINVAPDLARLHRKITAEISGSGSGTLLISQQLEDNLIHFTHARKVARTETGAPDSHRALQPWEYTKFIREMKIDGIDEFYSGLCEYIHPAASSVSVIFVPVGQKWMVRTDNEQTVLNKMVEERRHLLGHVLALQLHFPFEIFEMCASRFGLVGAAPE